MILNINIFVILRQNVKLECIGFVHFQPENIRQGIYGLVTIVLERAWAALKCDQLPVAKTYTYIHTNMRRTYEKKEHIYIHHNIHIYIHIHIEIITLGCYRITYIFPA